MKIEEVKALADDELAQFIAAGQEEQRARAEKRKLETIARIKEMAAQVGVVVSIQGQRGRPARPRTAVTDGLKRATIDIAKPVETAAVKNGTR